MPNGRASARPAAAGTPSPRKASRRLWASGASRRVKGRKITLEDLKTEDAPPQRRPTGIAEFDRVTGGGLVPGSALLVGGDPGIGKSTIILQALGKYAQNGGHADLHLRRRGDGAGAHARRPHGAVGCAA